MFGTGAIGIPGVLLVRFADKGGGVSTPNVAASAGGESFIAKLPVPAEPKSHRLPKSGKACIDSSRRPRAAPRWARRHSAEALGEREAKADEANPDEPKAFAANSARRRCCLGTRSSPIGFRPTAPRPLTSPPRCPPERAGNAAPARNAACAAEAERGRGLGEGQGDRDQGRGAGPLALSFRVLARGAGRREAAAGRGRLRVQYARGHAAVASVERAERPASASSPAASLAPTRSPSR